MASLFYISFFNSLEKINLSFIKGAVTSDEKWRPLYKDLGEFILRNHQYVFLLDQTFTDFTIEMGINLESWHPAQHFSHSKLKRDLDMIAGKSLGILCTDTRYSQCQSSRNESSMTCIKLA